MTSPNLMPHHTHIFTLELGCEELPPKALDTFIETLKTQFETRLAAAQVHFEQITVYGAPRRLAIKITGLPDTQPNSVTVRKGPTRDLAYTTSGDATPALLGFLKSADATLDDIEWVDTPKGPCIQLTRSHSGQPVKSLLPDMITQAFKALPIPKAMRWGSGLQSFARPTRWLLAMWDQDVLPMTLLEQTSGRISHGHRVHCKTPIEFHHADEYPERLKIEGRVIAHAEERRQAIQTQIQEALQSISTLQAPQAIIPEDLLIEVSNIVEWPVCLVGQFQPNFLKVPSQALIASMQGHQKCFPIQTHTGELAPYFLMISNLQSDEPQLIIQGNEKVMRARLSDAEFFYQEDLKRPLYSHLEALKHVTYQAGLGSMADKTARIQTLSKRISHALGLDPTPSDLAAQLSKCDLLTNMVMEFPELQGVMGREYALQKNIHPEVAEALLEQYQAHPTSLRGKILALADHIDSISGLFGIDQKPTGSKDPFALRRSAIRAMNILLDSHFKSIDLSELITWSIEAHEGLLKNAQALQDVEQFILERVHQELKSRDSGLAQAFTAAIAAAPELRVSHKQSLWNLMQRIEALAKFAHRPEAASLIAANKRVSHILTKSPHTTTPPPHSHVELLSAPNLTRLEPADHQLWKEIQRLITGDLYVVADQTPEQALVLLAELNPVIDSFFENTLVMAEDLGVREQRLLLLQHLQRAFLCVGDLSKLAANTQ